MRNAPNLKVERYRIAGPRDMNAGAFLVMVGPTESDTVSKSPPACDVCGSITVKTGGVYRCLNCGNSQVIA